MPTLTFRAEDHAYFVDGRQVLSVTQILAAAGLAPNYAQIPPAVLAHARMRGEYVDQCCDLFDSEDLEWSALHPEAEPYVRAWQRFRGDEGFSPIHSQGITFHAELDYAGTFDGYGLIGTVPTLVDRKCTSKITDTYALQLAGYAMPGIGLACEGATGELLALTVARRLVVQLRPDGTYRVYDCEVEAEKAGRDDFAAFRAAVQIARWKGANGNGR